MRFTLIALILSAIVIGPGCGLWWGKPGVDIDRHWSNVRDPADWIEKGMSYDEVGRHLPLGPESRTFGSEGHGLATYRSGHSFLTIHYVWGSGQWVVDTWSRTDL